MGRRISRIRLRPAQRVWHTGAPRSPQAPRPHSAAPVFFSSGSRSGLLVHRRDANTSSDFLANRRNAKARTKNPAQTESGRGGWRFRDGRSFKFAGNVVVPIHESALGIVAPGPDVQLEERVQVEAVGRSNELEVLPFE